VSKAAAIIPTKSLLFSCQNSRTLTYCAMPMMIDDIDALFTEQLNLPTVAAIPDGLVQRLDELQSTGCSQ
jgi:hypothetical protein